ncbi:MAG: NAD(P)H-dependent oxidoreductase [Akkermansia sp.]|nr:NAD(P)H-dependent oxidoreductase [Akkermansia sp.]
MKHVLIISSSLRAHSNSDALAAAFAEGAKAAGHAVETISLKGKEIRFCTACYACQKQGAVWRRMMHPSSSARFRRPMWWPLPHLSIFMK